MHRNLSIIVVLSLLAGCVTISDDAMRVQLHKQTSTLLADCQKLGPVRAEVKSIDRSHAERQVSADLRQAAFDQYSADTVVLVNSESFERGYADRAYANGIAYKCFK